MAEGDGVQIEVRGTEVQKTSEIPGRKIYHEIVTTIANVAVPFPRSFQLKSISVEAGDGNGSSIYVGGPAVTVTGGARPGHALAAGETKDDIGISNAAEIYVAGAAGLVAVAFGVG